MAEASSVVGLWAVASVAQQSRQRVP